MNEMFPNVRCVDPAQSLASVPDLPDALLLLARRKSGTKLERRLTELERAQISERIKEARVQAGLTQEELAELLHVRARTIANYEAGRVPWRLLGQIADATGKSQEWLLHGERQNGDSDPLEDLRAEVSGMADQLERIETLLQRLADPQSGSGEV